MALAALRQLKSFSLSGRINCRGATVGARIVLCVPLLTLPGLNGARGALVRKLCDLRATIRRGRAHPLRPATSPFGRRFSC